MQTAMMQIAPILLPIYPALGWDGFECCVATFKLVLVLCSVACTATPLAISITALVPQASVLSVRVVEDLQVLFHLGDLVLKLKEDAMVEGRKSAV